MQMSVLIINIFPAQHNRGPEIFSLHENPDAKTVIDRLSTEHGPGSLRDSQKMPIFSDPKDLLEAGHYTYTLQAAQGERCRSATCHT